ncbi:MAG: bifunctional histidinol-phosphatase/imidazoleglycerol-phosphate dehydratase HisB [Cyclobacteriaceae bacterium]|nr:bifunctional histidinol-phosphatase/imidazoleglycerol-phosphate dehydratase HisB [Cyclobacteriaceae bacterium]
MKKVLFIDRDGTLIVEPADDPQIDSLSKVKFIPGVFTWLGRIARETAYELVMVTNQDGLGTASFPEETFWPVQNLVINTLASEEIHFTAVHVDRSLPQENKPTRKPGVGMLTEYFKDDYDLANSFVIGDRVTDIELAKNLGAKGILLNDGSLTPLLREKKLTESCVLTTTKWREIYEAIIPARQATIRRTTKETDIAISVNLNGTGKSKISTGLGFYDHMLDQLARHGLIDLDIAVKGDLHIDEHHTIEDTALALGEAFAKALADKKGIERYGFCLPMDDCLAQVAIDFGGRPWLVWDAEFKREKIGEMPTEMFYHFFKSFSDAARCNLNIKAEGSNEHHKIESIFKAFAKAIKMAVRKDPFNDELPSTKGVI